MLAFAYRLMTGVGAPAIGLYLLKRRAQGREDKTRFCERLGYATQPRVSGRLIWCHAASVGEASSLLALIEKLRELQPATTILVTTGTVSSARLLQKRLPPGVLHQYIPVDRMGDVRRFLDHWRPDLAIWIESELWPNMLAEIKRRNITAVLLNGRMSEKSYKHWQWARGWARNLLGTFSLCLAQSQDERARFESLGAKNVKCVGNLKYAARPLPYDERALAYMEAGIGARPTWSMVSTHRGEEDMAIAAHKELAAKFPGLLTIIVPRHAVRGDEIAKSIVATGLVCARRSQGEVIMPQTAIYLADTLGELGLFYRLSPVVAMGGSFIPVGGHNPIEAAQMECAIVFGPHMYNFQDIAREFVANDAAIQLRETGELTDTIARLLDSANASDRLAQAALKLTHEKSHILDDTLEILAPWLGKKPEYKPRRMAR